MIRFDEAGDETGYEKGEVSAIRAFMAITLRIFVATSDS
jgi:hypothetical protein